MTQPTKHEVRANMQLTDEQIDALKKAALAATPQNIDSAQRIARYDDGSHIACPACGGEGHVEFEADFCNYDGTAIGVQFYGIGNAHGAAEAYLRAAMPANVLALIERLERAEAPQPSPTAVVLDDELPVAESLDVRHSTVELRFEDEHDADAFMRWYAEAMGNPAPIVHFATPRNLARAASPQPVEQMRALTVPMLETLYWTAMNNAADIRGYMAEASTILTAAQPASGDKA